MMETVSCLVDNPRDGDRISFENLVIRAAEWLFDKTNQATEYLYLIRFCHFEGNVGEAQLWCRGV
jgi:hypothetical protein